MHCRYAMTRGATDVAATAARLGRVVEHRVPNRCATLIDELLPDDDTVYRINRLRLRTWVDVRGMSDDVIAGRWAATLVGALRLELASGQVSNVVRFDSPRDFVAEFIAELPSGSAWKRWWFEEFHALRSVEPGEVVVRLLSARPAWIAPVLARLDVERRMLPVIESLDRSQAERLWHVASADVGEPSSAVLAQVAVHVRSASFEVAVERTKRARARLAVWAEIANAEPALLETSGVKAAVSRLVDSLVLSRRQPALAVRLMSGPLDATTKALLGDEQFYELAERSELLTAVAGGTGTIRSPFGGAALVLPALAELGCWEAWVDAGIEPASDYVFLVLLKVLGRRRAVLALGDPLLAALAGCQAAPVADARLPPSVDRGRPDWAVPLLARADAAEQSHLRLGDIGFAWLTPSLDAALSDIALAAVRATSAQFGRFDKSSLDYLASVFFAQPATFRPTSNTVAFEGGVLRAVLRLAGLIDEPVALPWLASPLHLEVGGAP
jgi:hypothetical protein